MRKSAKPRKKLRRGAYDHVVAGFSPRRVQSPGRFPDSALQKSGPWVASRIRHAKSAESGALPRLCTAKVGTLGRFPDSAREKCRVRGASPGSALQNGTLGLPGFGPRKVQSPGRFPDSALQKSGPWVASRIQPAKSAESGALPRLCTAKVGTLGRFPDSAREKFRVWDASRALHSESQDVGFVPRLRT